MNLSLFIMLLAFFIVLNSLSSFEEIKTEQVRRSVTMAFQNEDLVKEDKSSLTPDPAQAMREGHAFDRLDALFKAQIPGFEATSSKSRGVMMVQLPLDEFQSAMTKIDQKDLTQFPSREAIRGNFFLPTLVSILKTEVDDMPMRMEIMMNDRTTPAVIQNDDPEKMKAMIKRVSRFSESLQKQGMSQKLINVGLKKGNPDYINLVFRKHVAFAPTLTQEEGAP